MPRITMLLLAAALAATAQTPTSRQPGWCGFKAPDRAISKVGIDEPNQYAIPRGDLCEHYTFDAGWDKTMRLQLGEGAQEHLEWIKMAVETWNDAIRMQSFGPVLQIDYKRPRNYRISRSFWEDYEGQIDEQKDGENVIYFKPSVDFTWTSGAASVWSNSFSKSITEADIYINTYFEEARGGQYADMLSLQRYDNNYGVYLYLHGSYVTILHELGHALGLGHIPITGNIMSYSRWDSIQEQWEAPMALYMNMLHARFGPEAISNDFFVDRHTADWQPLFALMSDERARILTNFYTSKFRLGEMEKMMLGCSYDFDELPFP